MQRNPVPQGHTTKSRGARAARGRSFHREGAREVREPAALTRIHLQIMDEAGAPVEPEELVTRLAITQAEEEPFARRLQAMARAGQIMVNRRGALCVAQKLALVQGVSRGTPRASGSSSATTVRPTCS